MKRRSHGDLDEEDCDCLFEDVMGPGYPLMRMAMAHCPVHGHPRDCSGCWYCKENTEWQALWSASN